MRSCAAFVLCSAILLPSASARANDFCGTLTTVANEARAKFRSYRAGINDLGDYDSRVTLPGAYTCFIEEDGTYACRWRLGVEEDAADAAKALSEGIAGCFPKARLRESTKYPRVSRYVHRLPTVNISVGLDEKRNTVRLSVWADSGD